MSQALYFRPSYEAIGDRIRAIAPDLEVALLDEDGSLSLHGQPVALADIAPEYFWFHSEMYRSPVRDRYFEIMRQAPSAKWLHTINTGLDHLPYLALLEKGMCITNNHSQAIAIAEYVLGQVLARYQNIPGLHEKQARHQWRYERFRELYGERCLIIGFGHIGKAIAARLHGFGVTVSALRRSRESEGLAERVYSLNELDEALPEADIVILACTSNERTRNLVDSRFLALMKAGSTLVNISRGELVVEDDLHRALDRGRPDYAILDVFREEPLPADSWFWDHPRVALSPHSSNGGSGMRRRSVELFLTNLERVEKGETPLNIVSKSDIL